MAELLKGAPVSAVLDEETGKAAEGLKTRGVQPKLVLLRVGEKPEDLTYRKSILKRCEKTGICVEESCFSEAAETEELTARIRELNSDGSVHGVLMFLPFPKTGRIDERAVRETLDPGKDVDGCTQASLAGVFTGSGVGFAPCTAQAVMEMISYYGIPVSGKRVTVLGRSLVVGRPLSMLLLGQNATVTICHTKTENLNTVTSQAEILISTVGKAGLVDENCLGEGQTVLDVGISWNEAEGKLCGDVKAEAAQAKTAAYTPVPGGVGGVTTSVLAKHVTEAALRQSAKG